MLFNGRRKTREVGAANKTEMVKKDGVNVLVVGWQHGIRDF